MATIKSYTDINQSKKLAEILPKESADMGLYYSRNPQVARNQMWVATKTENTDIPCWSLAALLSVLPFHLIINNQRYIFSMHKGLDRGGETYIFRYNIFNTDICLYSTDYYNNPVDACYEMIMTLKEMDLL